MDATTEKLLLTKAQAAAMCSLGRSTFDAYRAAGYVPAPVRVGNLIRWDAEQIKQWVRDGCPQLSRNA